MLTSKEAVNKDYDMVLNIWERSVKATHHFLSEEDRAFYKTQIPGYLDRVELLLWYGKEKIIGFSGTSGQELDMLFIAPEYTGKQYGSKILTWLIENKQINRMDVNKQNKNAKMFYFKHGFIVESESKIDGFNKAYPILHLKKQ